MRIALAYNVKKSKPSLNLRDQSDFDFDSPETIDKLAKTIESLGHSVVRIEADDTAFEKLKENRNNIDLLFNIAEGLHGDARESQIPIFCEILKIKYTHSSPTTHAIKLNKTYSKWLLKGIGVKVPDSFIINSSEQPLPPKINYPVIIKPNSEGSSIGVFNDNVCQNAKALKKQLTVLFSQNPNRDFLVEEYIEGREFTVSVMGNDPAKVLPIIEQKFDFLPEGMNKIAGFELKWFFEDTLKDPKQAYDCPAKIENLWKKNE
jgi:D-alanine-D-alanine ligase